MELSELREMWKTENKNLNDRIQINEKRLNELTLKTSKDKLNKYINISIIGRNITFLYIAISIFMASKVMNELYYSIPAITGGLAMLLSFFQHLSLKKVDYNSMSIVELQKTLQKFRIHILKYEKFDKGIVALWFLTILPIYLKIFFKISIFSNPNHFIFFLAFIFLVFLILKLFPFDIYQKWDKELRDAEYKMNEILEFEKE